MKTPFFKKTALTAAVTASAALLAFSPLDSAGAKTLNPVETHFLQSAAQKNPDDLTELLDILNQSIYEKDGVYYFDSEKAAELGMDKEEAQLIQKLWDSSTEFLSVLSQCIEKEDGEYTFNKEKAVELGFTEKEALFVDQLFTAFSQSLQLLQTVIVKEDGAYVFDKELAVKAGIGKEQSQLYAGFFNSLPQEVLESIYTGLHPAA